MANPLDLFSINPGIQLGDYAHSISGTYTTKVVDKVLWVNSSTGAFTVTIATACCWNGNWLEFKDVGGVLSGANVTLTGEGGQTFDGAASLVLDQNKMSQKIRSDGTNWRIVG